MSRKINICFVLFIICFSTSCHKQQVRHAKKISHDFKLTKEGVDFTPILGCESEIERKIKDPMYGMKRKIWGYTEVVTCKDSGRSFRMEYSDIRYTLMDKKVSYKIEMISKDPYEKHVLSYEHIRHDWKKGTEVKGYTVILDGKIKKYTRKNQPLSGKI